MANETKTYGDFIAAMEETTSNYAKVFINEWKALTPEEQWEESRRMLLSRDLVLNFAYTMAGYFRDMIASTCTNAAYARRIQASHDFLLYTWENAVALGIDVKLEEIDTSITPTEALIASGAAKVVTAE
jgi:hypothetical protein